jgi:hypothetical protein
MMTQRKLERLQKQKRRLWHGDYPTRFGAQYKKLKGEGEGLLNELLLSRP